MHPGDRTARVNGALSSSACRKQAVRYQHPNEEINALSVKIYNNITLQCRSYQLQQVHSEDGLETTSVNATDVDTIDPEAYMAG